MNLIEKYKPKALSDLVVPNENIRYLLEDITEGSVVNNLLLTGTQGAQKTTIARLLPKLIERDDPRIEIIKGEADIDVPKILKPLENIVMFGGISSQKYQYVIFEEIDKVKTNLALFWQMMDSWGDKVILIATGNSYMAIDKSIRSRFKVIEMDALTPEHFLDRAQTILKSEGINLKDDYVLNELKNRESLSDIRKYMDVICDIHRHHIRGRISKSNYLGIRLTVITKNPSQDLSI